MVNEGITRVAKAGILDSDSFRRILTAAALFGGLAILQVGLAMRYWPRVGHDYLYFAPRLFDVQLHHHFHGFGVQWWTPSFGGGLPGFANPQHTQFSFPQIAVPWLGPYAAAVFSAAMLNSLGGLLVVKFLTAAIATPWRPALMCGLAFAANGFSVMALLVGHVTKFYFPLVALVPFLLMTRVPRSSSVAGFALLIAATVYAGGYAVIVVIGLAALILWPLLRLLAPESFCIKEAGIRILAGVSLGAVCCLLKLAAVSAWMKQVPRPGSVFPASALADLMAMPVRLGPWEGLWAVCLADVTAFGEILVSIFGDSSSWDHCISVHLPIWVVLGAAVGRLRGYSFRKRWPVVLLLASSLLIVLQIVLASGAIWTTLAGLPLLSSLHANHRFSAALVLPLVLLAGAWPGFRMPSRKVSVGISLGIAWIMMSQIALLAPIRTYPFHATDLTPLEVAWRHYRNNPESMRVVDKVGDVMDTEVFLQGVSSLRVYEPIFGYGIPPERFGTTLAPNRTGGPSDSNVHHPQAFVAPNLVGVKPFGIIPAADSDRAVAFLARNQPDWPQPVSFKVATIASGLALVVTLLLLVFPWAIQWRRGKRRLRLCFEAGGGPLG